MALASSVLHMQDPKVEAKNVVLINVILNKRFLKMEHVQCVQHTPKEKEMVDNVKLMIAGQERSCW